eukprot:3714658-Pyramimonas_sp.AAC.1
MTRRGSPRESAPRAVLTLHASAFPCSKRRAWRDLFADWPGWVNAKHKELICTNLGIHNYVRMCQMSMRPGNTLSSYYALRVTAM